MEVEIRRLVESDLPAALRLKELAHWNQTDSDWRRLLQLEPNGCFAATLDGEVVGTATTTTYEKELAWIGMVLVDPEYRRRGIGTELMKAAMSYLSSVGVKTVKLDATPAGRPVYAALGFKEESLVERWQGSGVGSIAQESSLKDQLRNQIFAMDQREFGVDRTPLLKLLLDDSSVQHQVAQGLDGAVVGYALARNGTAAGYIGPVVANDASVASVILDQMLEEVSNGHVYVDLNTDFALGRQILSERGFTKQRDLFRMSYGEESSASLSRNIFAIAAPEVG